jgi:simple sugar transport system permease protein
MLGITLPGLSRPMGAFVDMTPYLVTILILIVMSIKNKKENQPPASLGLSYFREER